MGRSTKEERIRLFDLYSANLAIHCPDLRNMVACPICHALFTRAGTACGEKLTIGHAYPRASGGRVGTLECDACNDRMNHEADAELTKYSDRWDIAIPGHGGKHIRGRLEQDICKVNIEIRGGPQGMWIHLDKARNNPKAFQAAREALDAGETFRLTVPSINRRKVDKAMLHASHLLLFREFGYGYLFTALGQGVRRLLASASWPDKAPYLSISCPESGGVESEMLYRVGICALDDGARCLFAALPSPDPKILVQFVLLPGPRAQDEEAYSVVMATNEASVRIRYRTIGGGPPERLKAPEYANYLFLAWDGWTEHNIDMTKIMYAIHRACSGNLVIAVNAEEIGRALGIVGSYFEACIKSLVGRGFLLKVSTSEQRFRVRLTEKGREPIEKYQPPRE